MTIPDRTGPLALTGRTAVLVVLALVLAAPSCPGDRAGQQEEEERTTSRPAPPAASPPAPPPTPPAVEPVDTEPIGAKLDRVIAHARTTREQYKAVRNELFDEAFERLQTILCSSYRIRLLGGQEKDFLKKDPDSYLSPLRLVLQKQGPSSFLEWHDHAAEPGETLPPQYLEVLRRTRDVRVKLPKSETYGAKDFPLARLTLRRQRVTTPDDEGLAGSDFAGESSVEEPATEEALETVHWIFDPRAKCEQSYREPVPNSAAARRESGRRLAALIAVSLQSLRRYPAKLAAVELNWSQANDADATLSDLQDRLTPGAEPATRALILRQEEALGRLDTALDSTRPEAGATPETSPQEIDAILACFR
jgi:hypothetical protein